MTPLWERVTGFDIDVEVIDGHDLDALRKSLIANGERPRFVFSTSLVHRM